MESKISESGERTQYAGLDGPATFTTLVSLTEVEMLVIAKCGDGYAISTFGATYTEPPTCKEAVDADMAWLAALETDQLARDGRLDVEEFKAAGPHIEAFLSGIGSAFFWNGEMPEAVVVPGKGRWVYERGTGQHSNNKAIAALQALHKVCKDCDLEVEADRPTEEQYAAAMDAAEAAIAEFTGSAA